MTKSAASLITHIAGVDDAKRDAGPSDARGEPVVPAASFTPLLSTEDVCALFGRTARSIRRWVAKGHLSTIRVGGAMFFEPEDIRALIATRLRQ